MSIIYMLTQKYYFGHYLEVFFFKYYVKIKKAITAASDVKNSSTNVCIISEKLIASGIFFVENID